MLTACGIETTPYLYGRITTGLLQQCLPLAVLKLLLRWTFSSLTPPVATVLTACGIETIDMIWHTKVSCSCNSAYRLRY